MSLTLLQMSHEVFALSKYFQNSCFEQVLELVFIKAAGSFARIPVWRDLSDRATWHG
jgi:hypothetical protein